MKSLTKTQIIVLAFTCITIFTFFTFRDINNQEFLDWDDNTYINSNPNIRSLSTDNIYWMLTHYSNNNWHPVTWLSYAFNYQFWGENAVVFKLTSIIIHLLTCFVLFLMARKLVNVWNANRPSISEHTPVNLAIYTGAIASLLFAIHPQHIESIVWISGRKDLLSTFFYLLGIYSYLEQNDANNYKAWKYATPILFVLSLMSKTVAVTFPVILILIDIFVLNKLDRKTGSYNSLIAIARNKLFYLIVSFCVGLIAIITQASSLRSIEKMSLFERILNTTDNLIHHLFTLIYPEKLSPYHPFSISTEKYNLAGLLALILVMLITAGTIYARKKGYRHLLAAWITYVVMLLPTSGLLRVGHAAVADRYAYLPTTVIFILAGYYISYFLLREDIARVSKLLAIISLVAVAFSFSFSTSSYAKQWRNDEALWIYSIKKYPDNAALPYINLGYQYNKQKKDHDAIIAYLNALHFDLHSQYALEYLGITFMQQHENEIGKNYFTKLAELRPDLAVGYIRLGDYHYAHSNIDKAVDFYNKAIAVAPNEPRTILRSALLDFLTSNLSAAKQKLTFLIQLNPDNYDALKLLAQTEFRAQNLESARSIANRMLVLAPHDKAAHEILAQINIEK